jgi:ketosteroid isomerase-like protein
MGHPPEEVQAAVDRYVEFRRKMDAGEESWEHLDQFFTDDMVFVDPAWGRVEGLDEARRFWVESMTGLEDWSFPVEFTAIDGDNVVIKWLQITPGTRPDGTPYRQSGVSTLVYAGDGKFSYEEDILNMVHVLEDLAASGWRPRPGFNSPPANPNRDFSRPA